jgi:hypothetical protein
MRGRIGVHRSDHAQIVGETGGVREQAADLEPALSIPGEGERRFHQVANRAAIGADRGWAPIRCPVVLFERGLAVERVYLTGSAIHEEEHNVLGACRKVRRLG